MVSITRLSCVDSKSLVLLTELKVNGLDKNPGVKFSVSSGLPITEGPRSIMDESRSRLPMLPLFGLVDFGCLGLPQELFFRPRFSPPLLPVRLEPALLDVL